MPRSFQVAPGRIITLPQGVQAGPGATNMRLHPGAIATLDDETCAREQRFLNGRLRAGDLIEVPVGTASTGAVENLPKPDPTKPMLMPLHGAAPGKVPPKKEG